MLNPRFWNKVRFTDSGCWEWVGAKAHGYPQIWLDGRTQQAHRVAYVVLRGAIRDGLTLDHLCCNSICVNPDHLEPVTHQVNILRGNGMAARHARRTHCREGHLLDMFNIRYSRRDGRLCLICDRKRKRQRIERGNMQTVRMG